MRFTSIACFSLLGMSLAMPVIRDDSSSGALERHEADTLPAFVDLADATPVEVAVEKRDDEAATTAGVFRRWRANNNMWGWFTYGNKSKGEKRGLLKRFLFGSSYYGPGWYPYSTQPKDEKRDVKDLEKRFLFGSSYYGPGWYPYSTKPKDEKRSFAKRFLFGSSYFGPGWYPYSTAGKDE